jgi:hypothetical protein
MIGIPNRSVALVTGIIPGRLKPGLQPPRPTRNTRG